MITHLPEDLLLEVIEFLSSDIRTLTSCALTSYAWAQRCRPYIFRKVNLGEEMNPEPRYHMLCDVLEKNPTFADYTHELHLFIGHVELEPGASCDDDDDGFVDIRDPGLPQFLGRFHQLEEVSITQWHPYNSRFVGIPKNLVKPFARIFGLESLRDVILSNFLRFPFSTLDHAVYVTKISLYSFDFGTQDPDQTPPTSPSHGTPNNPPPVRHRAPIFLGLNYCPPYVLEDLARLVRGREGLFEYHWIEELELALSCEDSDVDGIELCRDLLEAVGASQRGHANSDRETGLTRLSLNPCIANDEFRFAIFGPVLPLSVKRLVLRFAGFGDVWFLDSQDGVSELLQFLRNCGGALHEICLCIRFRAVQTNVYVPNLVCELDWLLCSEEFFPSLQKFRVVMVLYRGQDVADGVMTEGCEALRRWFPALDEAGRLAVECGSGYE